MPLRLNAMHKSGVILIVIAILAILSAVIYFALKASGANSLIIGTGTDNGTDPGEYQPTATGNFPLRQGSKGTAVKLLQAYINQMGNSFELGGKLVTDGVWGAKTQVAYALLQSNVEFLSSNQFITETEFNNYVQPHQHLLGYVG